MPGPAFESVEARKLGRLYDESYALVDVSVRFEAGTVTALLGPNGAGKSTLMGMLSTALRPSEGEVLYGGRAHDENDPWLRSCIGYLGHRPMLYGELSATENLDFFGRLHGVRPEATRHWLERVGLTRAADRPVSGFSRGMAQRLALARALMSSPSLLLLDEPFTGLDPEGVRLTKSLVAERRDAGATVVLVTHDLAVTDDLASQAVILRGGRLMHAGPSGGDLAGLYRTHAEAKERRTS
ncbi:heme ABC exporter ATP-binding protein CcmA [Myxococcota bacterium]|jgi:heme exporter protein A|nr:heme ABC exporter ATP-binding protein CcmA [Myxococcota bacterium]